MAGLSPRRPTFHHRSVHVGFVVKRGALGHLYMSSSLILILPLREGQAGKAWESSNKAVLYFSYKEVYDRKVLAHCSVLQGII
jgi:hypothetical protein